MAGIPYSPSVCRAIGPRPGILTIWWSQPLPNNRLINQSGDSKYNMGNTTGNMSPIEEQKICLTCGYCCDGTLFSHACLNPGERGNLPEKIEEGSYTEDGKDYFKHPCQYFSSKCTIYNLKRADVCGSYRCQLLIDFAVGKINLSDALEVVREAKIMRTEIIEEYIRFSSNCVSINFRQIQIEIGRMQKSDFVKNNVNVDERMLLARSNIFEALLIKYFRSAEDFEKLIMK